MSESLLFPASYEAVRVPDTLHTKDAIDEQVREAQQHFFEEIRDSLQISQLAISAFCRINYRMLVPHHPGQQYGETQRYSDDFISEFWFERVQPLATVVKVRDEWNWQVASFAKYPLLPRTVRIITELESIDDIIDNRRG